MLFFKFFKNNRKKQPLVVSEPHSELTQAIIQLLECDCEILPNDPMVCWETYQLARTNCKNTQTTPVLLAVQENILEELECNLTENGQNPKQNRNQLSEKAYQLDGKRLLDKWYTEAETYLKLEEPAYYSEVFHLTQANPTEQRPIQLQKDLLGFQGGVKEWILAYIPTVNPWAVFSWIPFGGWNECPMPEEMIAVMRYWNLQYGAVPAIITMDTIDLYLPQPIQKSTLAASIAKEQYGFCNDIVDQVFGTLQNLADHLYHSSVWSFWWD